jgi:hypothetical protein
VPSKYNNSGRETEIESTVPEKFNEKKLSGARGGVALSFEKIPEPDRYSPAEWCKNIQAGDPNASRDKMDIL